jgi:AraC-like DNA-binding protein
MMRIFKKETGQSVYEYLTERRLFFARELIRQGVPATESCFQAGFGSYSSFTRAYGKRFGTTPTGRNGKYLSMDEVE